MSHLVLGSAGQIGRALVDYLATKGEPVETFDIQDSKEQDLRTLDNPHLEQAIARASYVYFLAYDVGGSRYLQEHQHKREFILNNLRLMTNTFATLQRHDTPFLFTSSQMADMPHSTYGALKAVGEHATLSLGGTVVRLWNVYGLELDLNKSHVITDLVLSAIRHQKISIRTTGEETRQFLHATDCSRCLYSLSQDSQVHASASYDVTSFEWTAIKDIAAMVSRLYDDAPIEIGLNCDAVQQSIDVPPRRDVLGFWKPEISLFDGISSVAHALEKRHGKVF